MNIPEVTLSMNMRQVLALRLLCDAGSTTPGAIAKVSHITSSGATLLKDKLINLGLATAAMDPEDRRSVLIMPTDLGHQVRKAADAMLQPKALAA